MGRHHLHLSFILLVSIFTVARSSPLLAQGYRSYHQAYYPNGRSSVFAIQSIEGEYGKVQAIKAGSSQEANKSSTWRGHGVKNGVGVEFMRFTQFTLTHTLVNYRSKATSTENLRGSRISGEARVVFSSPIGNLEGGVGAIASTFDYQNKENQSSYVGSGYYHLLGLNYFSSSRVSFFAHGKKIFENLVRHGGNTSIENIKNDSFSLGLGIKLWI